MRAHIKKIISIINMLGPFGMVLFAITSTIFILSAIGIIYIVNNKLMVEVPTHGGTYTEGIVGTPRFINPLLLISNADKDISNLVYSGLFKLNTNGSLKPDIAESYDVSDDGTEYTVHLKPNSKFQDGKPVTAEDVIFTVNSAQNPAIKSPLFANWQGIAVSIIDTNIVRFILPKPSLRFKENLTLGILPKHLWQNVSTNNFRNSRLNEQPVGAGPYQITGISRDKSGIPTSYTLSAFQKYSLGEPYITTVTINCYPSETALIAALKTGAVMGGGGISQENLTSISGLNVVTIPINRIFAVFFNQNQNIALQDTKVRAALNTAINKPDMIAHVFNGYAEVLNGPIPTEMLRANGLQTTAPTQADNISDARAQLISAGWQQNTNGTLQKTFGAGKSAQTQVLAINISTGNTPEMIAVANYIKQTWTQLGVNTTVSVYEPGDLFTNAIQPRKYDTLVSSETINTDLDLFPFWHSSQRNDPGLNVAMYSNQIVDTILNKIHSSPDDSHNQRWYNAIEQQISTDVPAIFLYSSDYAYVLPKNILGTNFDTIEDPSDRFNTINQWYIHTDRVWPFFAQFESNQSN